MGNCCSCCLPNDSSSDNAGSYRQENNDPYYSETQLSPIAEQEMKKKTTPVTERDRNAQSAAASAAEARQRQFESSPVGRAAYRSERSQREAQSRQDGPDTAKDWLS